MLYFRFILDEDNSVLRDGASSAGFDARPKIYSLRGNGKASCLDIPTDVCTTDHVRKLAARYGRYAVVSFEGNSVFSITRNSDDSLTRQVKGDRITFASNPYWKNKEEILFVRRSRIVPLLDLLKSSGIVVMKWQLTGCPGQDDSELDMYIKESLSQGLSFSGLRSDPEGLFAYMCFRIDRIKFAVLTAVSCIVMLNYLLAGVLSEKLGSMSAELESIRRQKGEAIEMEKDADLIKSGLGTGIFPHASYIIDRLSAMRPKGILYTDIGITGKVITVSGHVSDSDSLVRLADSLKGEDYVADCSISSIKTGRNGVRSFTLKIILK